MSRLAFFVVLLMLFLLAAFLAFVDDTPATEGALESSSSLEATVPVESVRRDPSPSSPPTAPPPPPAEPTVTVEQNENPSHEETLIAPRIIGRAVDPEGKPLVEVRVVLMKSTRISPSLMRRKVVWRGRCDEGGRFRIDDAPMGKLIVVLDRFDPVHVVGGDRTLTVDAIQVYDLGDVVLGGEGHMKLSLKFLLPDGRPAAGRFVKLHSFNMDKGPRSGTTDDSGEVSFTAWAPEDGFSMYAKPPKGCDHIYAKMLPESQRPNYEGLLEEDGWLPRSREFIRFYPGDEFSAIFRFKKKKVVKEKMGVLVLHLPHPTGAMAYSYSASFLDKPPQGTGHSLHDGPPYEVKLPQGRLLVHVSEFHSDGYKQPFTARRVARKEILLGERYDWTVDFDDVIWAHGRLMRDGKPFPHVSWLQAAERSILPFMNSGKTDEKAEFLIPLDPYSKEWSFDFTLGEGRYFRHTIHRKPLITDEENRRVLEVGDVVVESGESGR